MNQIIIFTAKYIFLVNVIVAGAIFIKLKIKEKKIMTVIGIMSAILSLVILKISSHIFYNPRPFVVEHVKPLISHSADNGFPSDHTLLTMWLALLVFYFNKKSGIFLIILSILIGLSRVLALVHHPIDIIGAICIAFVSVIISRFIYLSFTSHNK